MLFYEPVSVLFNKIYEDEVRNRPLLARIGLIISEEKIGLSRRNKMAKRSKKNQKAQTNTQGLVVVALTKDSEQAREYETLLKVNDIPVVVNEPDENAIGSKDITVMVPEDYIDEAHIVIESQDAYDDFYDFALEEQEEGDFNGQLFEDEF